MTTLGFLNGEQRWLISSHENIFQYTEGKIDSHSATFHIMLDQIGPWREQLSDHQVNYHTRKLLAWGAGGAIITISLLPTDKTEMIPIISPCSRDYGGRITLPGNNTVHYLNFTYFFWNWRLCQGIVFTAGVYRAFDFIMVEELSRSGLIHIVYFKWSTV